MAKKPPPFSGTGTLLEAAARRVQPNQQTVPLAERMRPRSLEEVVGQKQLLREGKLLREVIQKDRVPSLVLWGPPGSGKTTLANVISQLTRAEFVRFSAVLGGLPELRELIAQARERRAYQGKTTLLFVDEIHRFNKSQQDAFLPHVEDGTITLIGATTENPSFSVNAAVLSRCRVFRLEPLELEDVEQLLRRALEDSERGLGQLQLQADGAAITAMARAASGDARRALGLLETAAGMLPHGGKIDLALVESAAENRTLLYDKSGEEHYNVVSAFIKSMRGSDPDAALYWLLRMLDAGDDPLFLLRRLIIFASEDVGNADPRALSVAVDAGCGVQTHGHARGHLSAGTRLLVLGELPEIGGCESGHRQGAPSHRRAWRLAGAEEATQRRHGVDEARRLRPGLPVSARFRGQRGAGRNLSTRGSRRPALLRADAAGPGAGDRRTPGATPPTAAEALNQSHVTCTCPFGPLSKLLKQMLSCERGHTQLQAILRSA
jgi:putative ATPase